MLVIFGSFKKFEKKFVNCDLFSHSRWIFLYLILYSLLVVHSFTSKLQPYKQQNKKLHVVHSKKKKIKKSKNEEEVVDPAGYSFRQVGGL